MLIFGASVNCIPWVYVPEILPLHARAKGTAIGISSNWLWVSTSILLIRLVPSNMPISQNFVIVMITPVIINRLQWKAYLIFMCTNLAFVPLVYFCYPETSNLTLEEIDHLYIEPGVHARHVAKRLHKERMERGGDPLGGSDQEEEKSEESFIESGGQGVTTTTTGNSDLKTA